MAGPEFFQTGMGHKFYGSDVPALIRQLSRIADSLEKAKTTDTTLYDQIMKVLRSNEGLCMDNEGERATLAHALVVELERKR